MPIAYARLGPVLQSFPSGFEHPEPLKPWKFHIEIRIPRDAIADALNLSEPEQRKLQETWSYFDAAA
jgi:hypothetical protein